MFNTTFIPTPASRYFMLKNYSFLFLYFTKFVFVFKTISCLGKYKFLNDEHFSPKLFCCYVNQTRGRQTNFRFPPKNCYWAGHKVYLRSQNNFGRQSLKKNLVWNPIVRLIYRRIFPKICWLWRVEL